MNDRTKVDPDKGDARDEDIPAELEDDDNASLEDVISDVEASMKQKAEDADDAATDDDQDHLGYVVPED